MGHRKKREPGPHQHAEGQHGDKTHKALMAQLQRPQRTVAWAVSEEKPLEGHQRLHQDGKLHGEAVKNNKRNST